MKGHNTNSVRLGGTTYPPTTGGEPNDFPEGAGLDSLIAMGAVVPVRAPRAEKKAEGGEKP